MSSAVIVVLVSFSVALAVVLAMADRRGLKSLSQLQRGAYISLISVFYHGPSSVVLTDPCHFHTRGCPQAVTFAFKRQEALVTQNKAT